MSIRDITGDVLIHSRELSNRLLTQIQEFDDELTASGKFRQQDSREHVYDGAIAALIAALLVVRKEGLHLGMIRFVRILGSRTLEGLALTFRERNKVKDNDPLLRGIRL